MKITLKTLKQQTFFVEVDVEKDTVRTLKEKLHAESGLAYPVDRQRLIYLGKIMEDDHPLSQYKLDDKKFIVVMSKKLPAADEQPAEEKEQQGASKPADGKTDTKSAGAAEPAAASAGKPSTSSSSSTATTAPAVAPSTGSDQKTAASTADSNPTTTNTTTATTNPSTEAVPEEMRINIQRLKEMGYSEQSARLALEICANIPDRAVEYLLSEMGGGSDMSLALAAQQQQQQQQQQAGTAGGAAQSGGANPLAFLRDNPVFEDMRRILRDDPSMLPYLMRRMQASNPELLNIIAEYQDEFLALINEGNQGQGGGGGVGGAGQPLSRELEDIAAAMVNSLTPSDMDAIERLKALGYPEHLVIQAYIACERDEYDAAMFLVTQTLDEEE